MQCLSLEGQFPSWMEIECLSREGLLDFALRIGEREVFDDMDCLLDPRFGEALRGDLGPPFSRIKRLEKSLLRVVVWLRVATMIVV